MFCIKCGNNCGGAKFCIRCGASVRAQNGSLDSSVSGGHVAYAPPVVYNQAPEKKEGTSFFVGSLTWFLVMLAITAIFLVDAFIISGSSIDGPHIGMVLTLVMHSLFLIMPIVIVMVSKRKTKRPFRSFLSASRLNKKLDWGQAGLVILATVTAMFMGIGLITLLDLLFGVIGYTPPASSFFERPSGSSTFVAFITLFFLIAVMPSITEEVFIHGVVQPGMEAKSKFFAVFMVGVMFSLMHMNPSQTIHQLVGGMIAVFIVVQTRSLWASILSHFVNNLIPVILIVFVDFDMVTYYENGYGDSYELTVGNALMSAAMFIGIFAPLTFLLLKAIARRAHTLEGGNPQQFSFKKRIAEMRAPKKTVEEKRTAKENQTQGERRKNILSWTFIVLGFAICLAFWTLRLVMGILYVG